MTSLLRFLRKPFLWTASRWRHEWRWPIYRRLFEFRHYRRLAPLVGFLLLLTVAWLLAVTGLALLLVGADLFRGRSFVQNVVASLLVLPVSLAIGVVVGTLLEKHSLRFKARHAGEKLADCVKSAISTFILSLEMAFGIGADREGPINARFVLRVRTAAARMFATSSWALDFPPELTLRLEETVHSFSACFKQSEDLRLAFPRAFDLVDKLESLMISIKAEPRSSGPLNTVLIILHYAAEILRDLE